MGRRVFGLSGARQTRRDPAAPRRRRAPPAATSPPASGHRHTRTPNSQSNTGGELCGYSCYYLCSAAVCSS
ncbi:hypothetical protein ACP4OV_019461 [Aristida adscensionis]